jgi:hypothetical protein
MADQAVGRGTVEYRHNFLVGFFSGFLVGGVDRGDRGLDLGPHHGTAAGVTLAALFGLGCALARGS